MIAKNGNGFWGQQRCFVPNSILPSSDRLASCHQIERLHRSDPKVSFPLKQARSDRVRDIDILQEFMTLVYMNAGQ